jgi:hypothetical protein
MLGQLVIRVTVVDARRVVGFVCQDDTVPRLLAACCSNPGTLEELLLATEAFRRGITRAVFDGLIDFDRAVARSGTGQLYQRPEGVVNLKSVSNVFEAIEPALLLYAMNGEGELPLLIIDLPAKTLSKSESLSMQRASTVGVHDGETATTRSVTYELPSAWAIKVVPPQLPAGT